MNSDTQPPYRVVPPSRRRDKPILSCTLCRRRKLKCDRQHPCKACMDRGLSLSCSYAPNSTGTRQGSKATPNVHDRIDQLEKLVTSLMHAQDNAHESPGGRAQDTDSFTLTPTSHVLPSDPDLASNSDMAVEIAGTPDKVKIANDETRYTNSGHWTSILDGIAELKDELDQIPTSAQPRDRRSELQGPDLLFGRHHHATREEILIDIPSRAEADKLVATYFFAMEMGPALLHRPTFLKAYEKFWECPSEPSVMWLGLLFAILCVASRFQSTVDTADNAVDASISALATARIDRYREKIVQCLILADYSKCPQYTIETLLLYFVAEYFRSLDCQFGTWIVVGMIVRISFRMGYHRDPSRFPEISVFQGEIRRRVWSMIVQLDLISSSQVGLPRMIQKSMYDTQEPRNLRDEDLDPDLKELPPSRPESEYTAMLYALARIRVLDVFGHIMDITNSATQPAYQDILLLDARLRDVYKNMPPSIQALRLKDFVWTGDDLDVRRLFLNLNFLKAQIMLHRPFLILGRTDARYEYSRNTCINAALEVLEFQRLLNSHLLTRSWSTKFRLWSVSWKLSSLVNHDFLLATTVLALDLHRDLTSPLPVLAEDHNSRVRFQSGKPMRAEIVKALTDTYDIWVEACEKSREAQKVTAAVRMVLMKSNPEFAQEHMSATEGEKVPSKMSKLWSLTLFSESATGWSDTNSYDQNFEDLLQPPAMEDWTNNIPANAFSGFGNPNSALPFPEAGLNPSMDVGGDFGWGVMETDFVFPAYERYLQGSHSS
ncbi:fungal-specific transcription factor domain-domain-containing protein [Clohesyomyces aquaticus]|uniref:Fungal-specific transcription factor domain-domain-containing protein n=1 Tax=Clohesyomyces aquaticus TaxID=1231657 RepID=A0A1Y1ZMV8_9PLEO|nr:fungal-specific transcription factor domain-domain-containing protein [Clohesyomyces aquaticus]